MKYLFVLIILTLFISQSYAQNFKGKITDKSGEILYGSLVYIKEINQGLVCNEEGYYQTTLSPGKYNIEYKCLGFKQIEKTIQIKTDEELVLDIILEETPFKLNEVTVSAKEDPAYSIMRKAIEKAPLYAESTKEYTADVYIKVNAELLKISSLLDNLAKKEDGVKISELKNQLFVQESHNEIQYTAPDIYKQTIKAFSSSIPDNLDSKDATGLINSSLYMPKVGMYVSPLNSQAFSYYKFRYEGFLEEEGKTINKIKVEPKLKDPILFDGYIYIADNTWHIYSAELATNAYGVKQTYTVSFQELQTNVFLPITYLITSDVSILGLQAKLNYYTSITYNNIIINKSIVKEFDEKKKSKKRNFEIARWDSLYTTTSDSLANKRDSTYWEKVRVVPLGKREIISFTKKDSIQYRIDSIRKGHHDRKFSFMDILNGGQIGGDSAKFTFNYNGLIQGALREYNFVDGLWLGQTLRISTKIGKRNRLEVSPYAYYALSRKRLLGGGDINLSYAPKRLGELNISIGSVSEDFNPNGIHRLNNFSSSLIYGENYNFFYQKNYISATNRIDLYNGLQFLSNIEFANRSGLSNNTDYTWGKKSKIKPNLNPENDFNKMSYGMGFDYTPYAYYTMRDGAKRYVKYTSPTLYIRYNHIFSSQQEKNSQHYKLYGGIKQNLKLSEYTTFEYLIEGGGFIGKKDQLHFVDYQHFNTANVTVNLRSPFTHFMLLDNYLFSTNEYWIRTNFNYESKYILLKRLPFLQGKMFTETLHLKNLHTSDLKLYTEVGYSLNFTKLLSAGAFASFKKGKYQDFGIRVLMDWESIKRMVK